MSFTLIDRNDLSESLESSSNASSTLIVDVRSESEYAEGHIASAINVPSTLWEDPETAINLKRSNPSKTKFVFHCKLSQQRGPTCAKIFAERLSDANLDSIPEMCVIVLLSIKIFIILINNITFSYSAVLKEGFAGWYDEYGGVAGKVEYGPSGK